VSGVLANQGPIATISGDRDRLLARCLLSVHPAVPRECQIIALLAWALDADSTTAAEGLRYSVPTVERSVMRFHRRTRALGIVERIPPGRTCAERVAVLIDLIANASGRVGRGRRRELTAPEVEALLVLSAATQFLVLHPLAGTLAAHRLRVELEQRRRFLRVDETVDDWLVRGGSTSAQLLRAVLFRPRLCQTDTRAVDIEFLPGHHLSR
jgi:predicted RNA polymerase sigma factor